MPTADARRDLAERMADAWFLPRFRALLDRMADGWRAIAAGVYPPPRGQGGNRGMSSMAPREFPE